MSKDSRLARMAHVLAHMGSHDGVATSEVIARMLSTNPVVVRRTMGELRDAGYVASEKGSKGGWRLLLGLDQITLLDLHHALRTSSIFTVDAAGDRSGCPVAEAADKAVLDALDGSRVAFEAMLSKVRLSDIAAQHPSLA